MKTMLTAALLAALVLAGRAGATPTENLGMRVLPAPGKVDRKSTRLNSSHTR